MKWATMSWSKFANDSTGLSSGRQVWSAAKSGRALRVDDQGVELAVALVERREGHSGVLDDALERVVVGVQHAEDARARLRELAEVSERVVEVLAGAAADLVRRLGDPLPECGLG